MTAATLQALAPDPAAFASGRHFAARIGLAPRGNSSGGKERIGRMSNMGNPALPWQAGRDCRRRLAPDRWRDRDAPCP
ncbi:transposase [Bradyrhizobium arachidis]|uniref:transposase n=1 Tax=Bradyrhizobium arachidis TaxID=858423 RepID=UPI0038CFA100